MKNPISIYSANTYDNRFGSWRKALEAFINYINYEANSIEQSSEKDKSLEEKEEIFQPSFKHKSKREISERLRFRILMRDGFTCRSCGKGPYKELGVELHVDHIIPWSKGGETVEDNLETKCKKCNLGKGNAFDV
jgi:5-methylcytosine-specific restriction endonuclease McrA